ncbi:MAG: CocE/NonD family hydrolase [Bacteroidota bacterium]
MVQFKIQQLCLPVMLFLAFSLSAQLNPTVDSIVMRDGKKLAADVYKPAGMSSGPVILIQTPYNRLLYRFGLPLGIGFKINTSNYIIVVADWRGFYGSRKAAYIGSPDRGKDGHDVVEWVAQQSWSNGKIGTWGPSALGKVQFQTAKEHPANLTCICPLVAGPQFDYDEYYPGGIIRTEYVEQLDALGYGLSTSLMAHPYRDIYWTYSEDYNYYPDSIAVPCCMIGGWYDHNIEVMLPFFNGIRNSSPMAVRDKHRLVMGPWVHGGHGSAQVGTPMQGELSYPNADGWNDSMSLLFFDYYLRNINNAWPTTPFVQYYQMGENKWTSSAVWPPAGTTDVKFYLHDNNTLDNTAPQGTGSLYFNYDPNDPSPTHGGPTLRSDLDQGPYDQSTVVESRNDILIYTTATLTEDVILKGQVTVHLKISSDKTDTDFDVRLTDVYPDGRSMLVNDGALRMRFRAGNTSSTVLLMTPNVVYDCDITLPNTAITFLKGHKIRLDVTSSNYPRFNRNVNTGGNMYPGNNLDSLVNPVVAKNSVYTIPGQASYITMPLVGYTSGLVNVNSSHLSLQVFPNPVADQLKVLMLSSETVTVFKVINALGQEVQLPVIGQDAQAIYLDTRALAPGVYTVIGSDTFYTGSALFVKQ